MKNLDQKGLRDCSAYPGTGLIYFMAANNTGAADFAEWPGGPAGSYPCRRAGWTKRKLMRNASLCCDR